MVIWFFIGIGGSMFVMAQFWMSTMFVKEWVGTSNATVAGWGNLGGGVTQLLVGSMLFPIFWAIDNNDAKKAWRDVFV
jgi:MFS transporter, NNP family, nitrate/nitrite transporter